MKFFLQRVILLFLIVIGVACDSLSGTQLITQNELVSRINVNKVPIIFDVRSAAEYEAGHVVGAINLPIDTFETALKKIKINVNDEVVVYCESGRRAKKAEKTLRDKGFFEVRHLEGDMAGWRKNNLPCENCQPVK